VALEGFLVEALVQAEQEQKEEKEMSSIY